MTRGSSALRIFLYNWPIYVATWSFALFALFAAGFVPMPAAMLLVTGALVAAVWSAFSLFVSHYVYDRSELLAGLWLRALLPPRVETWATVDAGLDAEVLVDGAMPGLCIARLDVFDGAAVRAPSIVRARARTPRRYAAASCPATALALPDASCDVITVVFTAHEVRLAADRATFFSEVRRALRKGGRMLLVEHVRDVPNFLAFGPGFLHFVARAEWLRLAAETGFGVAAEARVTPWVMVLALESAA